MRFVLFAVVLLSVACVRTPAQQNPERGTCNVASATACGDVNSPCHDGQGTPCAICEDMDAGVDWCYVTGVTGDMYATNILAGEYWTCVHSCALCLDPHNGETCAASPQ